MPNKLATLWLLVAVAGYVPAATISFKVLAEDNASTVERSLDSGGTYSSQSVGQIKIAVTSTSGFTSSVPLNFWTFCIEPQAGISLGSSYTYNFDTLANAPTNVAGGMGAIKANLLLELYGRYYTNFQNGTIGVVNAGALQVATWEIVRETSGTYDVTTGSTRFRNASTAAVLTTANTMLASLTGNTSLFLTNMYSITSAANQDLAFHSEAPEPGTAAMAAIGLAAFAVRLRRRANSR